MLLSLRESGQNSVEIESGLWNGTEGDGLSGKVTVSWDALAGLPVGGGESEGRTIRHDKLPLVR